MRRSFRAGAVVHRTRGERMPLLRGRSPQGLLGRRRGVQGLRVLPHGQPRRIGFGIRLRCGRRVPIGPGAGWEVGQLGFGIRLVGYRLGLRLLGGVIVVHLPCSVNERCVADGYAVDQAFTRWRGVARLVVERRERLVENHVEPGENGASFELGSEAGLPVVHRPGSLSTGEARSQPSVRSRA